MKFETPSSMAQSMCVCIQLTMDKLEQVRQSSSMSNSGTSSPRSLSGGDNQSARGAGDSDSESEDERLELKQQTCPVNAIDVSSLTEP